MSELALNFDFETVEVRTMLINKEPWFVGVDVALALGYSNPRDALAKHVDPEDKGVAKCDTPGGLQEMTVINEPGVYSLTFSSQLESAKRFKRWVTHEVLPSIRKQGFYSTMPDEQLAALLDEKINRDVNGKRLVRESRQQKSDMLFLERNKISHEDYVMQLRCIWGEDSYGFHKAFDDYIRWRNESKRGALA